jgi:ABC-type transporter Mla maintaining outer membrane lipid asymmetry ATPase subunit MlaF
MAIGRAILSNPKLLLLDEPTEGIQPSIVDQIEDVIIGFSISDVLRFCWSSRGSTLPLVWRRNMW